MVYSHGEIKNGRKVDGMIRNKAHQREKVDTLDVGRDQQRDSRKRRAERKTLEGYRDNIDRSMNFLYRLVSEVFLLLATEIPFEE